MAIDGFSRNSCQSQMVTRNTGVIFRGKMDLSNCISYLDKLACFLLRRLVVGVFWSITTNINGSCFYLITATVCFAAAQTISYSSYRLLTLNAELLV